MQFRIGHGYDVHPLVQGRPLIIGGVTIPHAQGLGGHSDADILAHVVMDALLGALALGDIGKHFPDTSATYKDADSMMLLRLCVGKMTALGYRLGNLDATLVAQQPKLADYLPEMRRNLAKVLKCEIQQINIKATTEERLGFTGKELGMAAHCVCLLRQTCSK